MKSPNSDIHSFYKSLKFYITQDRPYFFTSFVSTIDGKIYADEKGYWPIGSKTDYDVFTILRAHADIIIDGKNTATRFGKPTIETIHSDKFLQLREELGKKNPIEYAVISTRPDEDLVRAIANDHGFKPLLLTSQEVDTMLYHEYFRTQRIFNGTDRMDALVQFLKESQFEMVFVDGGPTLITSLVEKNLLDEISLTIAPKIYGSAEDKTLTMVEGKLLPPDTKFHLISNHTFEDEVFLRYKKNK